MANLEARKYVSPGSGFPVTLHLHFKERIKNHVPPEPLRDITRSNTGHSSRIPEKKTLFSLAKQVDLTESIGTILENVQLFQLNEAHLAKYI